MRYSRSDGYDRFRTPFEEIPPRERGNLDAARGYDILDCPYTDARKAEEWQAGWRHIHSRRQQAKQMSQIMVDGQSLV